jgi:diketogulonate reductase-like aldo/keto reductase
MNQRKLGELEVSANAAAVDVELTKDDLARIDELPKTAGERYDQAGMASVNR